MKLINPKIILICLFAASTTLVQADIPATVDDTNVVQNQTGPNAGRWQQYQKAREDCIQSRRIICGRVVKILPEGWVVDSGYTNLMRAPLTKNWLIPGSVVASRPANLLEANEPGAVCVGLVFLSDLPKSRGKPKIPKLYDYLMLEAFPQGEKTYASVGEIKRTVRCFTTQLGTATEWRYEHHYAVAK